MRQTPIIIIAFHGLAMLAFLATVPTLDPERGILAASSLLGVAPTPDAPSSGGFVGASVLAVAFAVVGGLFMQAPTAAFSAARPGRPRRPAR